MAAKIEIAYSLEEIPKVAAQIKEQLHFSVCTLKGNLGAGKTTLLKEIFSLFDVVDEVSSPSYSIVNEYKNSKNETLYHFDLYRIKAEVELYDLGFSEYIQSKSPCFIEWPEIAKNLLPLHLHYIEIKHLDENSRQLIFT